MSRHSLVRALLGSLTSAALIGCASGHPYYGTLIELTPSTVSGGTGSGDRQPLPRISEASVFDLQPDGIVGAVSVFRTTRGKRGGPGRSEAVLHAQQKASEVGAKEIVGIDYQSGVEDDITQASQFEGVVGLLKGPGSGASSRTRLPFVVCYAPPVTGTDEIKEQKKLSTLFGNTMWSQLIQNGYYPVHASVATPPDPDNVDALRSACPRIAGLYLTSNFIFAGGGFALRPNLIGYSRKAGAELELVDLNSGKLIWRKDGYSDMAMGVFWSGMKRSVMSIVRNGALKKAFVAFPAYPKIDGPAQM